MTTELMQIRKGDYCVLWGFYIKPNDQFPTMTKERPFIVKVDDVTITKTVRDRKYIKATLVGTTVKYWVEFKSLKPVINQQQFIFDEFFGEEKQD